MLRSLNLIFAATFIAVVICVTWFYQKNKYELKISAIMLEQSKATLLAVDSAYAETLKYQELSNEASKKANIAEKKLKIYAVDLDESNRRLFTELEKNRNLFAKATCDSVNKYATTLSAVYGDCRKELRQMGLNAQGHAIDVKKLIDSYPTN